MIGELWIQKKYCNLSLIHHFVSTYTHNYKTTGRSLTFYMLNDCSTIWNCIFSLLQVGTRYDSQVIYMSLKSITVSFNKPFVHIYTYNVNTTGHICTFFISNDCCTIRDIPCVVCTLNSDVYTGLQHMHTMLHQRTTNVCLGP